MYRIEELKISGGVTVIKDDAFFLCESMTRVTIPDSVTEIGVCERLESITLPKTITTINDFAFDHCQNLKTIKFEGTLSQWQAIDKCISWDTQTGNYIIICPDGKLSK